MKNSTEVLRLSAVFQFVVWMFFVGASAGLLYWDFGDENYMYLIAANALGTVEVSMRSIRL